MIEARKIHHEYSLQEITRKEANVRRLYLEADYAGETQAALAAMQVEEANKSGKRYAIATHCLMRGKQGNPDGPDRTNLLVLTP